MQIVIGLHYKCLYKIVLVVSSGEIVVSIGGLGHLNYTTQIYYKISNNL